MSNILYLYYDLKKPFLGFFNIPKLFFFFSLLMFFIDNLNDTTKKEDRCYASEVKPNIVAYLMTINPQENLLNGRLHIKNSENRIKRDFYGAKKLY
jgi:hypothetical protein